MAHVVRARLRAQGHALPVVAAGGIHTLALAEAALARGDCDIVAAARQSLADPDWWEKLRTGRAAEVRACTRTNYCEGLDQMHKRVTCRLWDRLPISADEPDVATDAHDGRRLTAPAWRRQP